MGRPITSGVSSLFPVGRLLGAGHRILLFGPPGSGKSTLAATLGEAAGQAGLVCRCIGADPGSPAFGVPGAICLGQWDRERWKVQAMDALCTLDAGRFRLPLVSAVARLAGMVEEGVLLVDPPGVVRGAAGAELLTGLVRAARIDAVIALSQGDRRLPLEDELGTLGLEILRLPASPQSHRSGKPQRARARTRLWNEYLCDGRERVLSLERLPLTGLPPPRNALESWPGRQVALLDRRGSTLAMGEIIVREPEALRVRLPLTVEGEVVALLVRDARRGAGGMLGTAPRPEPVWYVPPPDMLPPLAPAAAGGPCPVTRVGPLSVGLINGVFGDPLLHLRLRHRRRSLLIDLGEAGRLPGRIAHQVTDVFISHAHFDHIAGFMWLLRSRIGDLPVCRLYGPAGIAEHVEALVRGICWDRVGERAPRFEVAELHGRRLAVAQVQAGREGPRWLKGRDALDGLLLNEPEFHVRATVLDHGIPVLAFAFEPRVQLNVRNDRLQARGLEPGPWLRRLKDHLFAGQMQAPIDLPDGSVEPAGALADDLILVTPGKKLVYATDFADTADNRQRLLELAAGAHTLFCEASFREADVAQARATGHLTARACGEIATAAGVERLVPFHFSRRYEDAPETVYGEVQAACARTMLPGFLDHENF